VVVVASVVLAVDGGFAGAGSWTMTDVVDVSASVEIVELAIVELAS
jgi:hypothetical protein